MNGDKNFSSTRTIKKYNGKNAPPKKMVFMIFHNVTGWEPVIEVKANHMIDHKLYGIIMRIIPLKSTFSPNFVKYPERKKNIDTAKVNNCLAKMPDSPELMKLVCMNRTAIIATPFIKE